jgi:hypothetical protein
VLNFRTALLLTLLPAVAGSQILAPRQPKWTDKWNFGIGGHGGIPVGDFRDHENGGAGLDLFLGFQPFRREPLSIRGNIQFMEYGSLKAQGQQQVCDTFGCYIENVEYDARNHTMFLFQGGPEIMATDGKWRPYAFALAGVTVFNSTETIAADQASGQTESNSFFSSSNFSTSYGGGIRRVGTRWGRETGFEISARYTRNADAEYLTEKNITRQPDGTWVAVPQRGQANLIGIEIGFWLGPYINWNERR